MDYCSDDEDYDLKKNLDESKFHSIEQKKDGEKFETLLDRRIIRNMQNKKVRNISSSPSLIKRFAASKNTRSITDLRNTVDSKAYMDPRI